MEGYYLLDSDDDKVFKIYHKNRGEKSLPKNALGKDTIAMIEGLPKMAVGGVPEKSSYQQMMEEFQAKKQTERAAQDLDTEERLQMDEIIAQESADERMRQSIARGLESQKQGLAERGMIDAPAPSTVRQITAPEVSMPEAAPQAVTQTPAVAAPATPSLADIYRQAEKKKEESIGLSEQADLQKAKAAQDIYSRGQANFDAALKTYAAKRLELDNRSNQLMTELAEGKINPNHYWDNKSWGSRIGAAFSVALSGFGGGILGQGGNTAFDIINKEVERDIDAQKEQLNKTKNLLSLNFERTRNLDSAIAQTKADLLTSIEYKLKVAAAQASTPEAKAKAEMLRGQLLEERAKNHETVAKATANENFMKGISQDTTYLPEEVRKNLVTVPYKDASGKDATYTAMAVPGADVKKVQEKLAFAHRLEKSLDELEASIKAAGLEGKVLRYGDIRESGERLRDRVVQNAVQLYAQTDKEPEATRKQFERAIPTPGDFKTGEALAKIKEQRQRLSEEKRMLLKQTQGGVPGASQSGISFTPTTFKK